MSAALTTLPLAPGQRARALLLADPSAAARDVAALAGCNRQTVHRARRRLEAAGLIPERASRPPPAWRVQQLPAMPEQLASGSCVGHPEPDLWTSSDPTKRAQAKRVCWACPCRAACLRWALSLPASDKAIYGGMSAHQRVAIRRWQRARAAS
jgi:Transcription factor WhiB